VTEAHAFSYGACSASAAVSSSLSASSKRDTSISSTSFARSASKSSGASRKTAANNDLLSYKNECAIQQSWLPARAALSSTVFRDFFCLPALVFASSLLNSVSTAVAGSASSMLTESGTRTRVHLACVRQSVL